MNYPSTFAFLFTAIGIPVASGNLLLTEIQSNQAASGVNDYWEITNTGATTIDLGGYRWTDNEAADAFNSAAGWAVPAGTSIAAGESVIFTKATESAFRAWWNSLPSSVQVISATAAPGMGQNDGARLFDSTGTLVIQFSYAASAFTKADGGLSLGGHAGASAGGTATQAAVWIPASGTTTSRYTFADGTTNGTFVSSASALDIGSPGYSGFGGSGPSFALSLSALPVTFSESVGNPASTGTVTRAGSTTNEVVVNLSSSDTTEATVPATVTIQAGQSTAEFPITAVDDTFPDGSKTVTISATAREATGGTTQIAVEDDGDTITTTLMLTEIQSQQSSTAAGTEDYWELTNFGASTVSLAGYSWHDSGRSAGTAAGYALPPGTMIAPGESVVFTSANPADFRAWWNLPASVQVFQATGAPGLGQNDGISFFESGGNEMFFFSYAANGFTKPDGSSSAGGHAGTSAGAPAEYQALIWDPASGATTPRYTFATGANHGSFVASSGSDVGSPGKVEGEPSVSIASATVVEGNSDTTPLELWVTRSDASAAFSVDYQVTGGTATAGTDFTLAAGTLTFTSGGAASQPINITVNGDTDSEPDETVIVTLSNVVNTTGTTVIGTAEATGTIENDDIIAPVITTQPGDTTIASGGATTITVAASGFPTPTFQWYVGESGDTNNPVSGATSATFVTPVLNATTNFWVRATNAGSSADSDTATVTVVDGVVEVDLSTYVRVGRYNLPEPTRTALPPGTAAHNLLCQEASGVAYNWDTDTLFICGDGGRSITQVSKTGELIDTMSLDLQAGAPQGTAFYDPEGITYIGGGQFVFTEERERQIVKFTYQAGTTLTRAAAEAVDLGTFDDNTGTEGLSWDPLTGGFICLKEKSPIGVFQTGVDFNAGTATNGSATTVNSTNLFDTALLGMTDTADVFALSNLPAMAGQPQQGNLIVIGQENARVVNISRSGVIHSTLNIASDPGNPLSPADQQHEGITMDPAGNIYVVNENGGGDINHPQLWVYAPSGAPNLAPTAIALNNTVTALEENLSTASPVKVADIVVTDDGLGTNQLSLTGADAAFFEVIGSALYLKAGVVLDYEVKTSYSVTVQVDDTTVGATPDVTVNYTLGVTDQAVETTTAVVAITEVAPWSSGNSPVGADWFEVTNISDNPVIITGWKVDDSSNAFASALALNGITTIAPGESVIFIEGSATTAETFKTNWFGANVPAGLQVGYYSGGSIGLSTGGDEVHLFNGGGVPLAGVSFGGSDAVQPYQTFDNTVAANDATLSLLSETGVNGAFVAANSAVEIGSPGYSAPGILRVTEIAPWSSGNSPLGADWFEVTNLGAWPVNITGWKVDDSSESPAAALALNGIDSIAPGESVIFIETSNLAASRAAFLHLWFGNNPPPGLQVGSYSGSGIGLSTGGDAVNLYDTTSPTPVRRVNVSFGIAPSVAPFGTFDNVAGVNVGAVTAQSVAGVNGAFAAIHDADEIGSPGSVANPAYFTPFTAWLAANDFTSGGIDQDSDGDGLSDRVEYFFSLDPNDPADLANLPRVIADGGDLSLAFTRLTSTPGTAGALEFSGDLDTWGPAVPGLDYSVASSVVNGEETTDTYHLLGTGPSAPSPSAGYLLPNESNPGGATLGGVRVVNEGLVGVGRLSGENLDLFGETQGAASGLFITGWAYSAGQFSGKFQVLPDRGYGDGTSNYAARIHEVDFTFTPYYGTAATAQGQVQPVYNNVSTKFTYQDGSKVKFTTGLNPDTVAGVTGARTGTLFGQTVGIATAANGENGLEEDLLCFDAEAVHLFPDGSGYVSDEYGTYIARFDATKKITGLTQLPGAAQPHNATGDLKFDSIGAPANGRRNNQGLEGMSVTPDGTRLFALLQSATVQDTNGGAQQTRNHARLFVYDIVGANRENPVLVGEYVVRLPQIDLDPNTAPSALTGTAAQSEIVALGPNSFLMLPRDGNGLGKGTMVPITFKSVQLVDFASATNILGQFDDAGEAVSPGGVLADGVNTAATSEVINMLQQDDLAKFGLNLNMNQVPPLRADSNTLNEKIEGMALVPDISTEQANDFFLFVANDNDFQSSNVQMLNAAGQVVSRGDGRLNKDASNNGITNDAMYYVWRLTIDADARKFFRMDVTEAP